MSRRAHLHRLAVGSLTAASALLLLAAAPPGSSAGATTEPDGTSATTDAGPDDGADDTAASATATPGTAPDRASFERQIDMMLGLVPQDEVEAYYDQQNIDYERRIADCMVEAGFEYTPQDMSGSVSFDSGSIEWAQQWGFGMFTTMNPDDNPWMDSGEWHDPNGDYLATLSEAEQTAFWAQQNRCYENTPWGDDSDNLWTNSDFSRVMTDFWTDIENDSKIIAARRGWVGCMDEAGHPYPNEQAVWETWYSESQNDKMMRFYESEAWLATSPDHEEWQQLVDEEISLAVAVAECSAPIQEAYQTVTQSHRAELLELYQTIDWSAPPVTYPDMEYIDEWNFDGTIVVNGADDPSDESTPDAGPTATRPRIDLSGTNDDG